ncbi:hypothetical protein CPB84DRAFT_1742912 [Gymnopilus junonius]|uniref:Uncharacterized protein n=1 Tax=Gymnopilus junonius TaxID=109634 RepID=A0A9P5NYZ4_GYMJU|nr:hypothetical protein CPB84DRAFT_1742912 [Gymnopilus junonius]
MSSSSHVFDREDQITGKDVIVPEDADGSSTSTSASFSPTLIHEPHLMTVVDLRNNDLENAEEELFSFKVGFPDDEVDTEDAPVIVEERGDEDVPEHQEEQPEAPIQWLKINFTQWVMAIRRLFPIRFAEIFLRKAGQDLTQH